MKKNPPSIPDSPCHRTSNLYLGAFLSAKGFRLIGKENSGSKATLIFTGEQINEAVLRFYDDSDSVVPRVYAEEFKKLKDFIFGSR